MRQGGKHRGIMMQRWIGVALALLALACFGEPASAGKVGPGFLIAAGGYGQSVAPLQNGGFAVTWLTQRDSGPGGPFYRLGLRRYTATATLAGEMTIEGPTDSILDDATVVGLTNGGFAVLYNSSDAPNGRCYTAGGKEVGTILGLPGSVQSLAALMNGGFVAIFESSHQAGGQIFTAGCRAIGSPFPIHSCTSLCRSGYALTSVAALANGGFVATWRDDDSSGAGIYARRFTATGTPVGNTFQVNTYTTGDQTNPVVAGLTNGSFAIAWVSAGQDGSGAGVYAQRYNAGGGRAGGEFRVNTQVQGFQYTPAIAALKDGGFVVAWNGPDGDSLGVYGQRYTASALPVGTEFRVNAATAGQQDQPAVAGLNDGEFVVVLHGPAGIVGQRYSAARN
jgi:hypothetical protein